MRRFNLICGSLLVLICAATASAQQPGPSTPQLVVEQVQSGWVFTPDVRAADLHGDAAALAGGYIGRMTDRRWVFGAGGYFLANRDDHFNMWYLGPVVEYLIGADRTIGFGVRGLVGVGSATLPYPASAFIDPRRLAAPAPKGRNASFALIDENVTIGVHDDFFIAEPQVNVMWNLSAGRRIVFGVGYRQTGNTPYLGADLNGFSGAVSFQIGGK